MTTDLVLVTGAAGFVGGHVARELLERGYRVRALVHRSEELPAGVEAVRGDLTDVASLERAAEGAAGVVHAAAMLDPIADEAEADRVNHRGTLALAKAARRAGARAFVFLSSQAALGYHAEDGLVPPDAPPRPTTLYGKSKLAAERALANAELGGLRVVSLRPPTVYGPGERRNFLALTRAVDSGLFPIFGNGKNRMSTCWVGNVAAAAAWVLETKRAHGVLHVADEPVRSFREIVETLAWALGRSVLPLAVPLPLGRVAALGAEAVFGLARRSPPLSRARLRTLTADSALDTRLTRELGFRSPHRFSEGVARTVAWYRDQGLLRPR